MGVVRSEALGLRLCSRFWLKLSGKKSRTLVVESLNPKP